MQHHQTTFQDVYTNSYSDQQSIMESTSLYFHQHSI